VRVLSSFAISAAMVSDLCAIGSLPTRAFEERKVERYGCLGEHVRASEVVRAVELHRPVQLEDDVAARSR
jgi:hypothetical protein